MRGTFKSDHGTVRQGWEYRDKTFQGEIFRVIFQGESFRVTFQGELG